MLQAHDTPPPLSAGHKEERSPALQHQHPLFWSCRTFSSGLGEHLALCPPACRTALPAVKERGAGVSQRGRVSLEQHHALHAGANLDQVMQLRQPSRGGSLPHREPSKEPRRVRHTHSQGPQTVSRIIIKDTTLSSRSWK